jgi:hypothetical protein
MHVELFCMCQSITAHQNSMFTDVRGIFSIVLAPSFPHRIEPVIAVRVTFEPSENHDHEFEFGMYAPDGQRMNSPQPVKFPMLNKTGGYTPAAFRFEIPFVQFATPGPYQLKLMLDKNVVATSIILVVPKPQK